MYTKLREDVYGVFASAQWIATNYKAYPDNYSGIIDSSNSFVRISILPARSSFDAFNLKKKFNGLLIIAIFVKAGNGDTDLFNIADTLDNFFESKTLTNGTQFGSSTLTKIGLDSADKSLYRADYTLPFIAYGE